MKKQILFLFLIFSIGTFAQKTKIKSKKKTVVKLKTVPTKTDKSYTNERTKVKDSIVADNEVYNTVEINAQPPGGLASFYKFVANSFVVPESEGDTTGQVMLRFVVSSTGEISDIKILSESPKGIGLGAEAIRVLQKAPKWIPAVKDGKNVNTYYSLPIRIAFATNE